MRNTKPIDSDTDLFLDRVGARIRAFRLSQKLTLKELALRAGFPEPELSKYERGHQNFSLDRLRKIAAALGVSAAKLLDDEVEELPQAKPPAQLDPHYLVDPAEKQLIAAFRELVGKEQRIVLLLATEMRTVRDPRFDPAARKRGFNWSRPGTQPDPLSAKQTPANGRWLEENAEKYHGKWVALRYGKLIDSDPQRPVLLSRLVGQQGILLVNLLDIRRPKFERWSYQPPAPPEPPAPKPPEPPPAPDTHRGSWVEPNVFGHRVPASVWEGTDILPPLAAGGWVPDAEEAAAQEPDDPQPDDPESPDPEED